MHTLNFFRAVLDSQQNWVKIQSCRPCPSTSSSPPSASLPGSACVTADEPAPTPSSSRARGLHQSSLLVLYTLWVWTDVQGCVATVTASCRLVSLPWKSPELCSSRSHPAPGNHGSFYCLHSLAFSKMSYSWNRTVMLDFNLKFTSLLKGGADPPTESCLSQASFASMSRDKMNCCFYMSK